MINKKQSGRTMLEMLGALAIIGIMTAGGIKLYSVASENTKTTRFIDFVATSTDKVKSFYRNPKGGTRDAKILCDFELLPKDACDNRSGTTIRGYFNETITPTVTVEDNEDASRTHIYYNLAITGMAKSTCSIVTTNAVWKKTGEEAKIGATKLPLSVANAANVCGDDFDGSFTVKIKIK